MGKSLEKLVRSQVVIAALLLNAFGCSLLVASDDQPLPCVLSKDGTDPCPKGEACLRGRCLGDDSDAEGERDASAQEDADVGKDAEVSEATPYEPETDGDSASQVLPDGVDARGRGENFLAVGRRPTRPTFAESGAVLRGRLARRF